VYKSKVVSSFVRCLFCLVSADRQIGGRHTDETCIRNEILSSRNVLPPFLFFPKTDDEKTPTCLVSK
jgi:hypothetical protein